MAHWTHGGGYGDGNYGEGAQGHFNPAFRPPPPFASAPSAPSHPPHGSYQAYASSSFDQPASHPHPHPSFGYPPPGDYYGYVHSPWLGEATWSAPPAWQQPHAYPAAPPFHPNQAPYESPYLHDQQAWMSGSALGGGHGSGAPPPSQPFDGGFGGRDGFPGGGRGGRGGWRGGWRGRERGGFQNSTWRRGDDARAAPGDEYVARRERRYDAPARPRPSSRSRSPSPTPYAPVQPAYGPNGEYLPPQRRQRTDRRIAPPVPPSDAYLRAVSGEASTRFEPGSPDAEALEPLVLILDLNHTLLCRLKRSSWASKVPLVRPYLATFLEYICGRRDGSPRIQPIVYSSARAPNVLSMLAALDLIPPSRLPAARDSPAGPAPPYTPVPDEGDVLSLVVTREMMGLSRADYLGDIETVKDLGRVWELLGFEDDARDEAQRASGEHARQTREAIERKKGAAAGSAAVGAEGGQAADGAGAEAVESAPWKPNKKAKARILAARDERGAKRTLLLDDEASKAAQQSFSHLPIAPFLVHPEHFPSRPSSPRRVSPSPPPPAVASTPSADQPAAPHLELARTPVPPAPPVLQALSLDPSLPPAKESHLLSTIYQLDRLRCESNVARAVKDGALARFRDEAREAVQSERKAEVSEEDIDEELARRGREVCEREGIEVRHAWDPDWRRKLLRKEGRLSRDDEKREESA
ncbi:hypothetical protein Rhopal_007629-T1 [Rhodotorula paludigena]|uniref:FCP1 homology domain-containing protein n=1 Tax=Rhodotorula paludigena TaxID=86838 RepID=A0AAV5GPM9_9BASI|nr:hypothetical protein Rhopal_007629-T1 [Rhodotorula paludigena]